MVSSSSIQGTLGKVFCLGQERDDNISNTSEKFWAPDISDAKHMLPLMCSNIKYFKL
jgi:hypothetical protein